MSEVKWIKITTGIFDDEKILLIESLPDSYAIITCWFKLLCLAGKQNNSGVFMLGSIAYTDKMLATIFRMKESTVTMALNTFEQFGMVEIIDGVITIPNWGKHQSLDQLESKKAYMKKYMKEYRDKQKALTSGKSACKTNSKTNSKTNVSCADKEEDIEGDTEGEKESNSGKKPSNAKPAKQKYGEFKNVLLTEAEFNKLKDDFGMDLLLSAISFFDAYIEEKGYKSKSHNLAIRRWVIDAVKERTSKSAQPQRQQGYQKPSKAEELEDFYKMAAQFGQG
jgi:predicted phage replisome organizer